MSSKPASFAVRIATSSEFGWRRTGSRTRRHLLGRDLAVEVEQVEPAPHRGVEEDARDAAEPTGEPGHVRDARVRDDEPDALVAADERLEVLGDRRKPAAAVDEDRHRALDRELEDGLEPLVAQRERLRARVELDPARTEVEAAASPPRAAAS